MRLLTLLLVPVLMLAGCAGNASPAGSAAPSLSASASATAPPPPPKLPAVFSGICETTAGPSYGVAGMTYDSLDPAGCPFSAARPGDLSNLSAALIEVVWTPGTTVTGAGLIVESDHCKESASVDSSGLHQQQCNWGSAHGTSPMRLEIGMDVLAEAGADNLTTMVLPEGVTTSQAFTIYVTLFEAQMPSGYSAIPG